MNLDAKNVTRFGTYTVMPTVSRFTGEYGLTRAIEWARKLKNQGAKNARILNEFGTDLGAIEMV